MTASLPEAFHLSQNYPNPFNPVTTIRYQTGIRGRVILKIFDIIGREVAVLVNEIKEPGTYSVRWDAGKASSGVYFYQLQAGDFIQRRKMIVMQ